MKANNYIKAIGMLGVALLVLTGAMVAIGAQYEDAKGVENTVVEEHTVESGANLYLDASFEDDFLRGTGDITVTGANTTYEEGVHYTYDAENVKLEWLDEATHGDTVTVEYTYKHMGESMSFGQSIADTLFSTLPNLLLLFVPIGIAFIVIGLARHALGGSNRRGGR